MVQPIHTGHPEWPNGWGIFKHKCIEEGCDSTVQFDDEPWCFTHEPDEGGHIAMPGYSAKKEEAKKLLKHDDFMPGILSIEHHENFTAVYLYSQLTVVLYSGTKKERESLSREKWYQLGTIASEDL